MSRISGPAAPLTSGTIAAAATDYSKTFITEGAGRVSCSIQITGGTSGTVTCTFQISNDAANWTDVSMTNTFTLTGGAGTQTVTKGFPMGAAGAASTADGYCPAPYVRLKIVNGASASITNVLVSWMAGS